MKIIKKSVQLVIISLIMVACSSDDSYENSEENQETVEISLPVELTEIVLRGEGVVQGQIFQVTDPITGIEIESTCFTMDLVNPSTSKVIGTLQDCNLETVVFEDGSMISHVITTFSIDGQGTITSIAEVIQKPIEHGIYRTFFNPLEDNIIQGTGNFQGIKGTVSLRGEVDLSQFEQGIVRFNCTFTIKFVK